MTWNYIACTKNVPGLKLCYLQRECPTSDFNIIQNNEQENFSCGWVIFNRTVVKEMIKSQNKNMKIKNEKYKSKKTKQVSILRLVPEQRQ